MPADPPAASLDPAAAARAMLAALPARLRQVLSSKCSVAPYDEAGTCHQTCSSTEMLVLAPTNNYDNYWNQCRRAAESCACVQKP